ncbi:hypothetical protein RJ639_006951 [Escallonia herrerae]|uniref:Uncharacterized protein n=1 Tax=Escallonia herrerae TaxID=1293975 RepID=A0AA89AZJ7_9ASTE|nr:hypothetical protein RJ639_006951 [Escallonia herrerae]
MQAPSSTDDKLGEVAAELSDDLSKRLKLIPAEGDENGEPELNGDVPEESEEEDDDEDDDFSFVFNGPDSSPISAEDVFSNGEIRPIFPLFNRDLLFAGSDDELPEARLPLRPPVNKVFIEAAPHPSSSSSDGVAAGPYCAWAKKPEMSKKSNSTGFSKLWRFKDHFNRSHSDGSDAFVFLNNSMAAPEKSPDKNLAGEEKKVAGEVKASAKPKGKKAGKGKTASLTPHEVYLRTRGSDDRRRSYLPYRPELVGFFTNVNGGLSRNVHPF